MDSFKVLFCLFHGRKLQSRLDRAHAGYISSRQENHEQLQQAGKVVEDIEFTPLPATASPVQSWGRRKMKRLALAFVALTVPVYLAGCGGGSTIRSQFTPPASITSGTGTTGTSSTGTTGTSGTGTSGTSGTGTSGTSGTGTSGTSGTGTSGTSGTGTSGTSGTGTSGTSGTQPTSTPPSTSEPQGTVISDVQTASGNWKSWGQGAPNYIDCSPSPCNGYAWSMKYGITLPSLSNDATKFTIDGTKAYGDALFSAQLMGTNAPDLKDSDHTLLPTLHHFTYDVDFYVTDAAITQVLEFDISMYMNGVGMIFGTQCNYLGDKDWDIWDNTNKHWVSTGIPCKMVNGWNHLTIHVQRMSDNTLLYQSIELNGTNYALNISYPPGTAPSSWWGVTVNYQMDGDSKPDPNTTYLDNFTFTYW